MPSFAARQLHSLLLLSLFYSLSSASGTQCYYPNGQPSTDTPCNATADQSFCCAAGFVCLENKICLSLAVGNFPKWNRGSCTDQTWASSECPNFCQPGFTDGGSYVVDCGPANAANGSAGQDVCCPQDGTSACCSSASNIFVLSGPTSSFTTIGGAAVTSSTSSSSSSMSITNSASSIPAATSSSPASVQANPSSSALTGGAIAGVVIGAILGAALIGVLTFAICLTLRKRRSNLNEKVELPNNAIYQGPDTKPPVEIYAPPSASELEAPVSIR